MMVSMLLIPTGISKKVGRRKMDMIAPRLMLVRQIGEHLVVLWCMNLPELRRDSSISEPTNVVLSVGRH